MSASISLSPLDFRILQTTASTLPTPSAAAPALQGTSILSAAMQAKQAYLQGGDISETLLDSGTQQTPSSTGKEASVGLGMGITVPRDASPRDLLRIAQALRQQILQAAQPTIRDREIATLAARFESHARVLARSENDQRMAHLAEAFGRPEQAPAVIKPAIGDIIEVLDRLNQSQPEPVSYYAQEKMTDLLLDVEAPSDDLRLLDEEVLSQINGVVLDEPEELSLARQVVTLRAAYPGEDIFVDPGETTITTTL